MTPSPEGWPIKAKEATSCWSICFLISYQKTYAHVIAAREKGANVNKTLAQELQKAVIKNFKKGTFMENLRIIFGEYI